VRIGQLEFLEVLNLDSNCLEMIPTEIGNLSRTLKVLKLSNNKLKSITNRIREMHRLEILHLQNNQLRVLPDRLELKRLEECILTNNELEMFNLPIHLMPALQKIGLDWFAYLLPPAAKVVERGHKDGRQSVGFGPDFNRMTPSLVLDGKIQDTDESTVHLEP